MLDSCAGTDFVLLQVLIANQCPAERFKVVYKRATDLQLGKDVPICCNVVACDMLDEGTP